VRFLFSALQMLARDGWTLGSGTRPWPYIQVYGRKTDTTDDIATKIEKGTKKNSWLCGVSVIYHEFSVCHSNFELGSCLGLWAGFDLRFCGTLSTFSTQTESSDHVLYRLRLESNSLS
jgi:hypothetical protein